MMQRFTDDLREASQPFWREAVDHRFVSELFDGSISPAVMGGYLIQDHRFLEDFMALLGAAIASADSFEARLVLGRFTGMVCGEENTYFIRSFEALGISENDRSTRPDTAPTAGFKAIMREAVASRSYPVMLSVLTVAEWLYLDWAMRAPQTLPSSFVHAEWVVLHDNPDFRDFVSFLRSELDRTGPANAAICTEIFTRAVRLEKAFFDAAYEGEI